MDDKLFDTAVRSKLASLTSEYDSAAWASLEARLEQSVPRRSAGRWKRALAAAALLALIGLNFWLIRDLQEENEQLQQELSQLQRPDSPTEAVPRLSPEISYESQASERRNTSAATAPAAAASAGAEASSRSSVSLSDAQYRAAPPPMRSQAAPLAADTTQPDIRNIVAASQKERATMALSFDRSAFAGASHERHILSAIAFDGSRISDWQAGQSLFVKPRLGFESTLYDAELQYADTDMGLNAGLTGSIELSSSLRLTAGVSLTHLLYAGDASDLAAAGPEALHVFPGIDSRQGELLDIDANFTTLDFAVGLQYIFLPDAELRPFAGLDAVASFGISDQYQYLYRRADNSTTRAIYESDQPNVQAGLLRWMLGLELDLGEKLECQLAGLFKHGPDSELYPAADFGGLGFRAALLWRL